MRDSSAGGFTLLELMVAIGVVAILMLIALPTYWDRVVRQQVNEALPLAELAKPAVELAWRMGQPLPADNSAAGLPVADKIVNQVVSSVTLDNGAIHIAFGNRAHNALKGKTLTLRPAVVEDARIVPVTWLCGMAPPPEKMTAQGTNRTDVPRELLPPRCR
ncbi:pilin [Ramlibacter sp.]|uniref:pilin n=1 Tax=Ramlibacter sp. TaxID=1917967 RepID=UPI003D0AD0B1